MSIVEDFDSSKFRLGTLCKRGHEYKETGKTLRYMWGGCPRCYGVKHIGRGYLTIEERFWSKVDKKSHADGCWVWIGGGFDKAGYGRFNPTRYTHSYAHRYAWELNNPPIPDGLFALHRCDNPSCVNPDHLFLGTCADNKHDCMAKGRHAKGETGAKAKLKEWQVLEIRKLYESGRGSYNSLAAQFNVSDSLIWAIVRRKAWRHI